MRTFELCLGTSSSSSLLLANSRSNVRQLESNGITWGYSARIDRSSLQSGSFGGKTQAQRGSNRRHLGYSSDRVIQIGVTSFDNHCYKASNGINCLQMALTCRNVAPNQLASNGIKRSQHAAACIKLGLIQPVRVPMLRVITRVYPKV